MRQPWEQILFCRNKLSASYWSGQMAATHSNGGDPQQHNYYRSYYRFHVRPLGTQMSCVHHTEFVKLEKTVLTNRPKSVLKKTVLTDRGDAPTVGTNTILQEQTFGLLSSRRHSAAEADGGGFGLV
jgi:hypothetical protein